MAGMLNSNIFALLGPATRDLDFAALQKFDINPMELLGQLTDIYVNCSPPTELGRGFLKAVAEAPRYDDNLLRQAAATLHSLSHNMDKIAAFENVVNRIKVSADDNFVFYIK